jgi:glycosyltransferase involved in cell wall biosynthesis
MRIWFTEIGEPLPIERDVRLHRYGQLTRALAGYGHDVTWWTSNFSHAPKAFLRDADCEETVDGVRLRILAGPGYRRNVSLARFRHQADFARRFFSKAALCDSPDLIVSPIPTIETAALAVRYAREHNVPVLADIRDEWPDDLANLAPRPLRWIGKLVLSSFYRRMEYICGNANGIMAVSERQLNHGLKYAGRSKGSGDGVFPHGYSVQPMQEEKVRDALLWWREQGIRENAFVCCFFGTIGRFFDLGTVIRAASVLTKDFDAQFVLCGDGGSLRKFRKMAAGNSSILFPGWVDAPKIAALMRFSDVGLAPYAAGADSMSLPNKPFEYFAGSLPVVSSIQGELKGLLKKHRCGETYHAGSVEELSAILRDLRAKPDVCSEMGSRARKLLEEEYASEAIFRRIHKHFLDVVAVHREGSGRKRNRSQPKPGKSRQEPRQPDLSPG